MFCAARTGDDDTNKPRNDTTTKPADTAHKHDCSTSSAWLGWGSLLAVGTVFEIDGEDSLEFSEDGVEAQPAPTAFGRVSRNWVMKTPQGQYSRVVDTLRAFRGVGVWFRCLRCTKSVPVQWLRTMLSVVNILAEDRFHG